MTDIYIFARNTQKALVSYPHDQTYEFFQYAINKSKNDAQIVLVRKDNLLHYCYVRKIWNKQVFGLCLRIDRIYSDTEELFRAFDSAFTKLVEDGVILQMDSQSNVNLVVSEFNTETVAIREMSDKLIHALRITQKNTFPLPPSDYSISIKDCIDVSLEDSTNVQIINATKKYSNIYIVKTHAEIARVTELASLIKGKNKEIKQLQETVIQQDNTISDLKKSKNKYRWVLFLLSIIFIGAIVFFYVMQSQHNTIFELEQKNTKLEKHVKSLQSDSISLSTKLINTKKDLSKANTTISDLTITNRLVTDSLRQAENELSYSEILIEDKDRNIADLRAMLPQKYKTKYNEQYLFNKCAGEYTKASCYYSNKGATIIVYLKEDGYGLTHTGGWIPMNCLEKY